MPSLITHDHFGAQVYEILYATIGGSRDEADAFLLGNQGPDPLFYAHIDPLLRRAHKLGSDMHRGDTAQLLMSLKQAVTNLPESQRKVGRAYALGFLCHYLLDRTVHPLVYYFENAICDAGIEGLDRQDRREVHAVIESELDELILTRCHQTTVRDFDPGKRVLRANDGVLDVISKLYVDVAQSFYGKAIPASAYRASLKHMRTVQSKVFHSSSGMKRWMLDKVETSVRRHSFLAAMSHRAQEVHESAFDNHDREPWIDPLTERTSTASFWDLLDEAKSLAIEGILAFDAPSFDLEAARAMTRDLNFAGEPTTAVIIAVE